MTKIPKLKIFFISCCLLFAAVPVFAAEVSVESKTQEVAVDEQFQVDVLLNTQNEEINAVEGKVIFPRDLLELKEIRDGATIVNFWIERPKVRSDNQIIFSGIIPGGYQETKGFLFSVVFQARASGSGAIEIRDTKVLLNDGEGTPASVKISPFQFSISQEAPVAPPMVETIKDTDLPEAFEPIVASDPTMFDGKYFLVFATQDKGSGIDHYEILEKEQCGSLRGLIKKEKWQVAESPYLLKDQNLRSYIFVKAIDKAGNERVAELPPQNPLKWYENYSFWIIIIVVIILTYITWITWRILRKKKIH